MGCSSSNIPKDNLPNKIEEAQPPLNKNTNGAQKDPLSIDKSEDKKFTFLKTALGGLEHTKNSSNATTSPYNTHINSLNSPLSSHNWFKHKKRTNSSPFYQMGNFQLSKKYGKEKNNFFEKNLEFKEFEIEVTKKPKIQESNRDMIRSGEDRALKTMIENTSTKFIQKKQNSLQFLIQKETEEEPNIGLK